jgi:radical SAM protein with 4Fe4S-binding SPASM domain
MLSKSWGCNAGTSNIAFLPNGDIAGCSSLAMISKTIPDLVFGNINDGIVQNKIDSFIQKARADLSVREKCRTCAVVDNCTGGCLAINYSTNQNAFDPPSIYCESIRTIEEAWEIAWGDRCLTTSSN